MTRQTDTLTTTCRTEGHPTWTHDCAIYERTQRIYGPTQADAEAALAATSTVDLLTKAYALTHRIHANSTAPKLAARGDDLRAQRDLITAEVMRRTGDQA